MMTMAKHVSFALALAGAALALGAGQSDTARAQTIADSFAGFSSKSSKQPIDIEADSLEVLDDKKVAVFAGNVKARQGKFELISKQLKVTYSGGVSGSKSTRAKKQNGAIKTIEATGKVAIKTPDNQSATSDWAKFDVPSRVVTIGGNVVLSQGGNVMRGDKLIIDLKTGRSRFDAATGGKAKKGKRPRITGVFMPGASKGKSPFTAKTKSQSGRAQNGLPPLPIQKNAN